MREKPLLLWVIAESFGKVLACHCKAGLGEACSHVASLLWTLEAGVRLRDAMPVTQKKAYWVYPLQLKNYCMLLSVNSLGHSGSLRALQSLSCDFTTTYNCTNHTINSYVTCNFTIFPTLHHFPTPSPGEVGHFASLSTCSTKPAILALLVDYSSNYIPSSLATGLPICFSDMLKQEYLNKPFD